MCSFNRQASWAGVPCSDVKVSLSSRQSLQMTGLRSMLCVALHCRTHRLKLFTAGKQADEEQDNTNDEDNFSCPCCCAR